MRWTASTSTRGSSSRRLWRSVLARFFSCSWFRSGSSPVGRCDSAKGDYTRMFNDNPTHSNKPFYFVCRGNFNDCCPKTRSGGGLTGHAFPELCNHSEPHSNKRPHPSMCFVLFYYFFKLIPNKAKSLETCVWYVFFNVQLHFTPNNLLII